MKRVLIVWLIAFGFVTAIRGGPRLVADSVVIVTTTISGSVSLGDVLITAGNMRATTPNVDASSLILPPASLPALSVPYTMTVGLVQGTTPTYTVEAFLNSDEGHDSLTTFGSVVVGENVPAELNLTVPAGFVDATFTVSGGTTVIGGSLTADKYITASSYHRAATNVADGSGRAFRFPAVPQNGYNLYGSVRLSNGLVVQLPTRPIDVAAHQTTTVNYVIDGTAGGTIDGTVSFDGLVGAVNSIKVFASGSAGFQNVTIDPAVTGGAFRIGPLAPGFYAVTVDASLNQGNNSYRFPTAAFSPSYAVNVTGSHTVTATATQAAIHAPLTLRGLHRLPVVGASPFLRVAGVSGSATAGGFADARRLTAGTTAFDVVASGGAWQLGQMALRLERGDPFLRQDINYRNDPRIVTASPSAPTEMPFDFNLGEIAVRIVRAEGGVLSFPRLEGSCTHRDASNTVLWSYSFISYSSQVDVTTGSVSFVGPAGVCTVGGSLRVDGQTVGIPTMTLTMIPGVSQDVDAGGPALLVTSPEPGVFVSTNSIVVAGTASDDTGVESITVNGMPVALTAGASTGDANAVSFETTVVLPKRGPHTITTVVRDVANPAKTATDRRTIYWDTELPTVTFAPADGATTSGSSLTVTGTADDDAGIKQVLVNGVAVSLIRGGNTARPNQVTFSRTLSLPVGTTPVAVTVTDVSNQVVTETHTVTRLAQAATTLSVAAATGLYGDAATLRARLVAHAAGVAGKPLAFSVAGRIGSAVTDVDGWATLSGFTLSGIAAGFHPITATFAGDSGYAGSAGSGTLTVLRAPIIIQVSGPVAPSAVDTSVEIGVTFDDVATNDSHVCTFAWADGTTSSVNAAVGQGSCTSSHPYSTPGVYTVAVTVTDDDQLFAAANSPYVVVYDMQAGFVTGAGWITSPAGAYLANPALTGRAHFGFVSRYQRGTSVPTGDTAFHFDVADLRFKSTAYEWLVVAGTRAQFKGRGAINGAGDYGFLLTAVDGDLGGAGSDKFRMKIWDRTSGAVVYDNLLGAAEDLAADPDAIGGGNIAIHSK